MIFTCSTKFGVSLINSNPKNFRYDLVWVKSAPCGFLNAKKMPMKKHEMVYIFYKKLPKVYTDNIAEHHTHKFIKSTPMGNKPDLYGRLWNKDGEPYTKTKIQNKYEPSLPTSVIKDENLCSYSEKNIYSAGKNDRIKVSKDKQEHETRYEPSLPTSVIRTDEGCNSMYGKETGKVFIYDEQGKLRNSEPRYEPPLPNSIIEIASQKGKHATQKPVDLIKWCLKYYSKEGDIVLDPTMGSGSTGVACKEMNRRFIGIELDEDIYKVACGRLET
jgi:hypothetical protein